VVKDIGAKATPRKLAMFAGFYENSSVRRLVCHALIMPDEWHSGKQLGVPPGLTIGTEPRLSPPGAQFIFAVYPAGMTRRSIHPRPEAAWGLTASLVSWSAAATNPLGLQAHSQMPELQAHIHGYGAEAQVRRTVARLPCPMQARVGRASAWRVAHTILGRLKIV
jgi:hypothetical protein